MAEPFEVDAAPAVHTGGMPPGFEDFLEKWDGPSLEVGTADEVPGGLAWKNGQDEPEIGDPQAVKGGVVRLWNPAPFPSTFRSFGPNSIQYFRYPMFDRVEMPLVGLHPVMRRVIPALACEWAEASDGRTVFFRIDPEAKYSNGRPVKAADFLVGAYVRCSVFGQDPFYAAAFRGAYERIRVYDDRTLSVTMKHGRPLLPFMAARGIYPAEPGFYAEFGSDFPERYQWRVAPTTGAYRVDPAQVVRGRKVVLERVKDWWARERRFYRWTCNVDAIEHVNLPDELQAWELFRKGELDVMVVRKVPVWQDRLEIPEVFDGYVEKATFFGCFPEPPYGIYLNTAVAPLDSLDVRLGLQHALHMDAVESLLSRGEGRRLASFSSGYGKWSLESLPQRDFSPEKAREYFARAGYSVAGKDGVLRNAAGDRLSIALSYSNLSPSVALMVSVLRQYAAQCGVEVLPDCDDMAACARKVYAKKHQSVFWAEPMPYPLPENFGWFHSSLARDAHGGLVPDNNNITSVADAVLDKALEAERDAATEEALERATHAVQRRIYELAVWVPGWRDDCARLAYWRWLSFPDTPETRFSVPDVYNPLEAHLYWIDEERLEETQRARREGKSFGEVDRVYADYRAGGSGGV